MTLVSILLQTQLCVQIYYGNTITPQSTQKHSIINNSIMCHYLFNIILSILVRIILIYLFSNTSEYYDKTKFNRN